MTSKNIIPILDDWIQESEKELTPKRKKELEKEWQREAMGLIDC